ncbi:autophagy protein 5 [Trapelia coarctata]|nr:autophagy protein 5 [Trapelia coarctata]
MATSNGLRTLQFAAWRGSLPLEIRLAPSDCRIYDRADPYLVYYPSNYESSNIPINKCTQIHSPRLSYLPFLLPRLHAFFTPFLIDPDIPPHDGWFSFEGVPLKWHYPIGLLYDLFSGAIPAQAPRQRGRDDAHADESQPLPWRLTLHITEWPADQLVRLDAEGKVLHDAFINSVKEADFLRNGTAKEIMSLSKNDSTQLWKAVQDRMLMLICSTLRLRADGGLDDFEAFNPICQKLLYAQGAPLRHAPMRIYLPQSPSASEPSSGHLKVVQSLITPTPPNSREPQTLGMALHSLLPSLFPSRRTPILAKPVLHGAVVPMSAPVEELLRGVAYLDGWLHLGVVMMG